MGAEVGTSMCSGSKIITVDVEELWNNDFSWRKNIFSYLKRGKLKALFLNSALMMVDNPDVPADSLPLMEVKPLQYVERFKSIFNSIRTRGYAPTEKDIITVYSKGNRYFCCDGHRRLVSILVLGRQKKIAVSLSSKRMPGCSSPRTILCYTEN